MVYKLSRELNQKLNQKRFIFTITTGRSGTQYLSKMMSLLSVTSDHEGHPRFSDHLAKVQFNQELAYKFWVEEKLPHIASTPHPYYVDLSHLFCKGFVEPLLDIGIIPDVIVHRRNPRDVALSFYKLGSIPSQKNREKSPRDFHIFPDDPTVITLPNWQNWNDYQLCYWSCLEVEKRSRIYSDLIRSLGGKVVYTTFDEVIKPMGFWELVKSLDLPKPNLFQKFKYYRLHRKPSNQKVFSKKMIELPNNLDELENTVIEGMGNYQ